MTKPWYNEANVSQKGSVVLNRWLAERKAARADVRAEGGVYPLSSGAYGSELYEWLTMGMNVAGVAVNERTAMSVSAVYACVGLISGAIGSLPLPIYRRTPDGGRERTDSDLWWLLNEQPHPVWSAAAFWEYLVSSFLLVNDGFARILRATKNSPRIVGFEPMNPHLVEVKRVDDRLVYFYPDGDGKVVALAQDDVLHFPGVGFDGLRSLSPIRHAAKKAVGIAIAADDYSASFFSNGARPDFALMTEKRLDEQQTELIRKQWTERYGGPNKAHLPAVLSGGITVKELALNPEDAQLVATRRFQVEDICRIYGVPPFMVGHTEKTTSWGAGVEQMGAGFVRYTLQRHLTKIEQELNRKLFRTSRTFCEFNVEGLLRGDSAARREYYKAALGGSGGPGWMTQDEVRRLENLPPKGGDAEQLTQWKGGGNEATNGDGAGADAAPGGESDGAEAPAAGGGGE